MNPLSFLLCRTSVWLAGCRLGPSLQEGLLSERPLCRALGAAPALSFSYFTPCSGSGSKQRAQTEQEIVSSQDIYAET